MKINLVKLIAQAAPQVHGSDERAALYGFLVRNAGEPQIVEIDLTPCLVPIVIGGDESTCSPDYPGDDWMPIYDSIERHEPEWYEQE